MTAALFGAATPLNGGQTFTVLSDGRVVVVTQDYAANGLSIRAQFLAPDGTALGGPIVLNPSGSPNFSYSGSTHPNPQVQALTNGGFVVLGEQNDSNGALDYVATFDANANQIDAWTAVQNSANKPDQGQHTLVALTNGGFYIGWTTEASSGTSFNPLLGGSYNGGSLGFENNANEGADAQGAVFTAGGALSAGYVYNTGTYYDLTSNQPYNGLAGDQLARGAVALPGGAVVQTYLDTVYDGYGTNAGEAVVPETALSFSINGGPRTLVYATAQSNGSPVAPVLDTSGSAQILALANGTFAVLYATVDDTQPSARVHSTYAAFYNADGSPSTTPTALILTRTSPNQGNDSFHGDPISVVALPSGGFAVAYIDETSGGAYSLNVALYDATGALTQPIIPLPETNAVPASVQVAADGSLYVQSGQSDLLYHIAGTAPGDFVLDHSAATANETLTGTSATDNWLYAGSGSTTIIGGPGAIDYIYGGTGAATILGGVTRNVISAGAGNGLINGNGGATTVIFDGNQAAFAVATTVAGTTVTTIATGAVENLVGVQTLQFGDGDVSLACFATGTRIATSGADCPVERLAVGDMVRTAAGELRAVKWIGHRRTDCRRHKRPHDVWPVRVSRGAFGPGSPCRDLHLSPDHAVFVDGALMPIRYLVNGASIVQTRRASVTYWHVELDAHDVILAEGLPCESYLDTGNRSAFSNGGSTVQLHPDFALGVWEAQGCAPLVRSGATLASARSMLLARAKQLGHEATSDPALHVMMGDEAIMPSFVRGTARFRLPPRPHSIRLTSRHAVASHMRPNSDDCRRLGVAISRIIVDGDPVDLADARLSSGWHDIETSETGRRWRWTDGDAGLAIAFGRVLQVEVAMTERYWGEAAKRHSGAAA